MIDHPVPHNAVFHDVPATSIPHTLYLIEFLAAFLICWVLPIRNPLSRDEIGTFWIVKDGLSDAVSRSYYWTNWSPYYLVEWVTVHLGGMSEIVMRLPSVLAMVLAAWLLFRIGAQLWDREAGLLAALVFSVMPDVGFAAGDARPYAFTLVALCAYTLAVLRWVDTGRLVDALLAALFATLTAYGHVLLSLGLVVPALYALWRRPKSWHLWVAIVLVGVLCIPLVTQLRAYMAMNTSHYAGFFPVLDDLWAAFASAQFVATVGVGAVVAFLIVPRIRLQWGISPAATAFLVAWACFAPALLFALARLHIAQLFLGRYLLSTALAQALLYGALIRAVGPPKARALVGATVLVAAVVAFFFSAKSFHGEGWKDALAAVRAEEAQASVPLVMTSPFVEAESEENLNDPKLRDVLFSPVFAYPPDTPRLVRLPFRYNERIMAHVADADLAGENGFVLLTADSAVAEWFTQRFASRHAQFAIVGEFRGLTVYRFRMG